MNYFLVYSVLVLIASVLMGLSTWKLFKKMGYNPLFAFVPFYNYYIILKETGNPKWWAALSYLPIVGPIMMSVFHVLLMKHFGKKLIHHQILTILLPFIYMATVNYSKDPEVEDNDPLYLATETPEERKKETFAGSITFAVVFATIIHVFITQPFGIPTGSMERTLLVGDFLFVNKLNYGYRMPMRPVAIPFLQGTIMSTGDPNNPKDDPKSYVDAISLPYFRFPGWEKPEKNDVVVFNYPQDSVHTAIDRKDPYVKRCVAVGGDIVEMRNGRLFVNGQPEKVMGDAEMQHNYLLQTTQELDVASLMNTYGALSINNVETSNLQYGPEFFAKHKLNPKNYVYSMQLTEKMAADMKQIAGFVSIEEEIDEKGVPKIAYFDQNKKRAYLPYTIFPYSSKWNNDWYGPIAIPKKGDVITLTAANLPMYERIIREYEGNTLISGNNQFLINGQPTTTYKIKYDYYFMMGDNRDGSLDARYFGFVPETHIVGKPMFTWMSLQGIFADQTSDYQAPFKIRWDRMFKATNTGDPNKTSYWWIAATILVLFFGWEYFAKLFKKKKDND